MRWDCVGTQPERGRMIHLHGRAVRHRDSDGGEWGAVQWMCGGCVWYVGRAGVRCDMADGRG